MSERLPRDKNPYCRHCGREDIDGHWPWCIRAADEPLPEDPPLDDSRADQAEDAYADALAGEFRR